MALAIASQVQPTQLPSEKQKANDNNDENMPPPPLLTEQTSQDVFLLVEPDSTTVKVAESKHAGHKFFQCLAELNRRKFIREYEQNPSTRMVASALVSSLCNNGRGRIFIKYADASSPNNDNKWKPVLKSKDAVEFIFKALLNMYNMVLPQMKRSTGSLIEEESTTEQPKVNKRKRTFEIELEAAESLLLVSGGSLSDSSVEEALDQETLSRSGSLSDSSVESRLDKERLPPKKRVRFESSPCADDTCDRAKRTLTMMQSNRDTEQAKSGCRADGGIPFAAITDNDVLCGGSGEGILATSNVGNLRFQALIDANVVDFYTMRMDKRKMLAMAKLAVKRVHEASPRGRFLVVNPTSKLWYEVKPEKAWSKALRTFQLHSNQIADQQHRAALRLLLESQKQRERRAKLNGWDVTSI